jgi:hypothetical protein
MIEGFHGDYFQVCPSSAPSVVGGLFGLSKSNTSFYSNIEQVFHYRCHQRDSFLTSYLFRFSLGIARDQRAVSTGCWFRGAKHANILVHLRLKLVSVNKGINSNRTKKMADALSYAARWNFISESERYCKRPQFAPLRTQLNMSTMMPKQ